MAEYKFPFDDLPYFGNNVPLNKLLSVACTNLEESLRKIAPRLSDLGMSPYSQRYMDVVFGRPFRRHYNLTKYSHILSHALESYDPAQLPELTVVDYGGGHGVLSLIARKLGVGTVVHSEIFPTSSQDAQILVRAVGAKAGPFFLGDTHDFRREMDTAGLKADVIVNYDVLEHVYNLRQYFIDLHAVTKSGGRWFMGSGANFYLESERQTFHDLHAQSEGELGDGNPNAYANMRAQIVREHAPSLLEAEVHDLAIATRGWRREDIERAVDIYLSSGHLVRYCPSENNTADPRNGNWAEHTVPFEVYTDSPVLASLAQSIQMLPAPLWNPFIMADAEGMAHWNTVAAGSRENALRLSPYYCLDVRF